MGIVCGGVSCCHTPSIPVVGARHAVAAFRGDHGVGGSRDGQMGSAWVLRPFVRTRLLVSDIDTPSPYDLEWRRWSARRQTAPLLISALVLRFGHVSLLFFLLL